MSAGGALTVTIELDEPGRLSGWLTEPDGRRQRFTSWLELASAFAVLRDTPPADVEAGKS
jgi:hypothetical protein